MLAVFTVSVGYGVVLPLLPSLVQRLQATADAAALVSRHTGLLTATYALALFLAAPAWGRLSDAYGRRNVLVTGMLGFSAATAVFSAVGSIGGVYVQRFLSGIFAAAAVPVGAATIGDLAQAAEQRGRRLAFLSMAGIAGFLIGPTLGVFVSRVGTETLGLGAQPGSITIPLASMAVLGAFVSVVVAVAVPNNPGAPGPREPRPTGPPPAATRAIVRLLALTFIVSSAIGVFEVGLALRGTQELLLTPYQIALMFTECSLVMFAAQAAVFSPWIKPEATSRFITPALTVLLVGLLFVPWASDFVLMLTVVGGVAAGAGVASPIFTYWISTKAGPAQGWQLGKQTAAASLGMTAGSAAGGLLFNVGGVSGVSFLLTAGLVAVGLVVASDLRSILAAGLTDPDRGGRKQS
ncbi:MAG: MFS transporter [Vicinamibacterales bacterium]